MHFTRDYSSCSESLFATMILQTMVALLFLRSSCFVPTPMGADSVWCGRGWLIARIAESGLALPGLAGVAVRVLPAAEVFMAAIVGGDVIKGPATQMKSTSLLLNIPWFSSCGDHAIGRQEKIASIRAGAGLVKR